MASSPSENVKPADDQASSSSAAGIADVPAPPHSEPSSNTPKDQGSASTSGFPQAHAYHNVQFPFMFDMSWMRWSPETFGENNQSTSQSPLVPILCPVPLPGHQGQFNEQPFRTGGIFAVPMVPIFGSLPGFPPSGLIPVSYNIPQNIPVSANSSSEPVDRPIPAQAQEPGVGGPLQDGGLNVLPPGGAHPGLQHLPDGQRQIVRRFHVAFQIDLLLILKLAVVVFIFSQDGSRDRLLLLVFLAGLAYLYKTGALTPLLRRISRSAQRAMMPPQQRQPVRELPAERGIGQGGIAAPDVPAPAPAPAPVDGVAAPVDNHAAPPVGEGGAAANAGGDHAQPVVPPVQGATWWGFLKEVQMIVVGFVTSLLPGFHQHID